MKLILASSLIVVALAQDTTQIGDSNNFRKATPEDNNQNTYFSVYKSGGSNGQPQRGSCYVDNGSSYEGTRSQTIRAEASNCQNWEAQTVHRNYGSVANKIRRDKDTNQRNWNHNYCRNPDQDPKGPWCMTTNPGIKYAYCGKAESDFEKCPSDFNGVDCKHYDDGLMYAGKIKTTANGNNCLKWSDINTATKSWYGTKWPSTIAQNYCRNPDNDKKGPWCFTSSDGKQWGYCSIPRCQYEDDDNNSGSDSGNSKPPGDSGNNSSGDAQELTCGLRCIKDQKCDPEKGYTSTNNIIGGEDAGNGEFPWQAQLRQAGGFGYCGASILNRRWVLSAAHCISSRGQTSALSNVNVAVGFRYQRGYRNGNQIWRGSTSDLRLEPRAMDFGRDIYASRRIFRPVGYDSGRNIEYDIALIQTRRNIHYGTEQHTWSRPACIPHRDDFHPRNDGDLTPNVNRPNSAGANNCIISGWGKTNDNLSSSFTPNGRYVAENDGTVLQWVKQDLPRKTQCTWARGMLKESQVCVQKARDERKEWAGSCNGDSGGPMTCTPAGVGSYDAPNAHGHVKMVQIGLTSYGSARGCATTPSVYTRLTGYESWIQYVIRVNERSESDKTSLQYMDKNGVITHWFSDENKASTYSSGNSVEGTGKEAITGALRPKQ